MVKCIQFCFKIKAQNTTDTQDTELHVINTQPTISTQPVATNLNVPENHTTEEKIIKDESTMEIVSLTNNSISAQEIEPSVSMSGQQVSIAYFACPVS